MAELQPPEDDGLFAPDVKRHSADKHWYLNRYVDIFTGGMKNQPWELHYIDLFASAGIVRVAGRELQWGSPLIAAQACNRFHRLHLCEKDPKSIQALRHRVATFAQPTEPQVLDGDANDVVDAVVEDIPMRGTLSLAFLDPYGLHLDFETLRVLTSPRRKVDLIIYFPDRVDALRNFGIYLDRDDSNLDRFLGGADWRSMREQTPQDRWAEGLQDLYLSQIRSLDYGYFDSIRIRTQDNRPIYKLIFCSRHERGGDFWRKIAAKERGGQSSLFG